MIPFVLVVSIVLNMEEASDALVPVLLLHSCICYSVAFISLSHSLLHEVIHLILCFARRSISVRFCGLRSTQVVASMRES